MMAESRSLLSSGSGAGSGMHQPVLGNWGRCKMNMAVRSWTAGEDEFGAGAVEGGGEGLAGFHPAVDGDAMDAVSFGGIGEGGAGGQGVDDALLDGGEGRCIGGVFHSDVRVAWAGAQGRGFWGRFALFSGGYGGMPVCDRSRSIGK